MGDHLSTFKEMGRYKLLQLEIAVFIYCSSFLQRSCMGCCDGSLVSNKVPMSNSRNGVNSRCYKQL